MAYKQFTKKYRPHTFGEVVGQRVAVGTLEEMFSSGKIAPAIMITGEFGTGKTSLGRLIASYANCKQDNGDICSKDNLCISCKSIEAENNPDVIEINAAESRGIDGIRELITLSKNNPTFGNKYKVFILDEVHQLSGPAVQALLKPLEEPSPKTIWVLITTEPQRVPKTVTSRCRVIKLASIADKSLITLLTRICKAEKATLPEQVLANIASMSYGHARNAVMMLEHVLQYTSSLGDGSEVLENLQTILEEMEVIPPEILAEHYVKFLLNGTYDALDVLRKVNNFQYFLYLVVQYTKNIAFMFKEKEALILNSISFTRFWESAVFNKDFSSETLCKILDLMLQVLNELRTYENDPLDVLDVMTLKCIDIINS